MVCDDELEVCWDEEGTIQDILNWLNSRETTDA